MRTPPGRIDPITNSDHTDAEHEHDNLKPKPTRTVCLIGDIHGHFTKLQSLWSNLQSSVPSFHSALIIFLGDYCDRGPDTRLVLDFLISLPSLYPHQTHVFLSGNHDFAFAAFLGLLPLPEGGGSEEEEFRKTWKEYEVNEEREGWFRGDGFEKMHLQGRMWGGEIKDMADVFNGMECQGSIFDAAPTFLSYGVPHGSADLVKAVPEEHKKFLANLQWVHEEDDVCIETPEGLKHCRLIAVHAGLENGKDVEAQLRMLKAKDTRIPQVENLSGRKSVWDIPQELTETPTIVVSGHHGKLHIDGLRLIIDESGGYEHKPLAALVLPTVNIIRN